MDIEIRNILAFRLHAHHLDREYGEKDAVSAAGACGLQNSPPGAWETSLHNRVPGMSRAEMERERDEMLRGVQENVTELVLLTASKLSQKELDEESDRKLVDSFLSEAGDKP